MDKTLKLQIKFLDLTTVPVEISSFCQPFEILEMIKKNYVFHKEPMMIFHGKILNPFISLYKQNVVNNSEIILSEKASLIDPNNSRSIQITPLNSKLCSILNEFHRLEDLSLMLDDEGSDLDDSESDDSEDESNFIQIRHLTVLGPDPKAVSEDPLPFLMNQSRFIRNPEPIQFPQVNTCESLGQFLCEIAINDWKW